MQKRNTLQTECMKILRQNIIDYYYYYFVWFCIRKKHRKDNEEVKNSLKINEISIISLISL